MREYQVRFVRIVLVLMAVTFQCSGAEAQDSSSSPYQVVEKVVLYNNQDRHLETAGVVRCNNGDLLVAFFTQTGLFTTRSKDNGLTWQKAALIATGAPEASVGMVALHDGTILLPFQQDLIKQPCCDNRRVTAYIYRSMDNGLTWQGDAPIESPMRETVTYGHILQLEDGRVLMPIWGARNLGERWQVGTLESTDEGKTWETYRQIAYDPQAGCRPDNGFNETDLAALPDHTLLAVLRQQRVGTHAGPCDHYAEPSDYFYRAVSHDLGKSWSKPERLDLIGTSPCLHVTPDGTLMLAYRDSPQVQILERGFYERPQESTHYGLAIRVSRDQGRTWIGELGLQDPQGLKYSVQQQPGYPDMVDLPDSKILIVFFSKQIKDGKSSVYLVGNVLARASAAKASR